MIPRPLAAVVTAGSIALFTCIAAPANACSCMKPDPPTESLAKADAVFEARAAEVRGGQPPGTGRKTVTLDVLRAWKGLEVPQVTVTTAASSAACGFDFEEGKSYLLYAQTVDGALSVGLCSRSQATEGAGDDLEALGKAKYVPGDTAPAPAPSPAPPAPHGDAPLPAGDPPVAPPPPPPEPSGGGCAGCATASRPSGGPAHGWGALLLGAAAVAFRRRSR